MECTKGKIEERRKKKEGKGRGDRAEGRKERREEKGRGREIQERYFLQMSHINREMSLF